MIGLRRYAKLATKAAAVCATLSFAAGDATAQSAPSQGAQFALSFERLQSEGLKIVAQYDFAIASSGRLAQAASQPPGLKWADGLNGTQIVPQRGLIIKGGSGDRTAILTLPKMEGFKAIWLFAQINGWSFYGSDPRAVFLGFGQHPDRYSTVAHIRFRYAGEQCDVTAEAAKIEEGATSSRPIRVGPARQGVPLSLALEYQAARHEYRVFRVRADGSFALLGEGRTSPTRFARVAQILVRGDFGEKPSEYLEIGMLALAIQPK